jgi:serine protease Do
MLKKWISGVVLLTTLAVANMHVYAKDLPDFTELAEKQGPAVVNISITSTMHAQGAVGFPGMPNDENIQEFFKRFGIPGMPGMPDQGDGGQDYKTQ